MWQQENIFIKKKEEKFFGYYWLGSMSRTSGNQNGMTITYPHRIVSRGMSSEHVTHKPCEESIDFC